MTQTISMDREFSQELAAVVRYIPGKDSAVADYITRNLQTEVKLDVSRCFSIHLSKSILSNDEILAHQLNDEDIVRLLSI